MNHRRRVVMVGAIVLGVVVAPLATVGSVAAGTKPGGDDVGSRHAATMGAVQADTVSPSCSYFQADTRVAYDGSSAGVLDPRTEDRLPVLLGGFSDTSPTFNASQFEQSYFGTGTANVNGTGTLRDYYHEATDGLINLTAGPAGVNGWYETSMESDRILESDGDFLDFTPEENSQFVRRVIEQADSDVDFSAYDNDDDGCIAVVVVYQGVDMRAHATAPWGNFFEDANFNVEVDGVTVSAYARVKEVHYDSEGNRTGNRETVGTPAHEIGHLYGLPDLYAETDDEEDIGPWGLMASGNYGNRWASEPTGSSPVHPTAWSKLLLLQHPSPEIDTTDEYVATIPRSGRPGILPPATQNQYYRINPQSVAGCQACDGQYYLLGYRALTGFDEGLRPWSNGNSSLRISRVDGPWDGDLVNDPSLIHGVNRLAHFGDDAFNASTSSLARLADGSDSGVDLRNFSTEHGMATFNDPPHRHLDADETAVFAVPVGQTLPDGTRVGDDYEIDHRVATNSSANMTVWLLSGFAEQNAPLSGLPHVQGDGFLRIDQTQTTMGNGYGGKIVHRTDQSTDYISATTYPTFPLPSAMSLYVDGTFTAVRDGQATASVDVQLTAAGDPYDYGQFGAPEASDFDVEIGGVSVDSADLTLTEHSADSYTIETPLPTSELDGYDVSVAFTESKAGVRHHVEASESMLQPILDDMAGDGSAADPYQIRTVRQLQALDADHDAQAELVADIDASATASWFGNNGFVPIGNSSARYPAGVNVTLDGNGHTVSGLYVGRWNVASSGLFAGLGPDGEVRDLRLANATVSRIGEAGSVGAVAGTNRGTIDGVSVTGGTVETTTSTTGGLVGRNTGTVTRSAMSGSVEGESVTGGLVGESTGTVSHSYAEVTVTGGSIGASTGGLIGSLETEPRRSTPALVTDSFAVADVEATTDVGGLVGTNFNGTIARTYSQGTVTGERRVGSLVGLTNMGEGGGTITNSYAAAQVEVSGNGGTVWGSAPASSDSYWDGSIRAVSHGVNDTVLDTGQMQGEAARTNMDKLDFETVWRTVDGDYPQFQWYVDGRPAAISGSAAGAAGGGGSTNGDARGSGDGDLTTPGASGPGLGVLAAVLALVLAGLALAIRNRE